ncbi:MAG: Panacea domain-containing protein, partial [bacterium]
MPNHRFNPDKVVDALDYVLQRVGPSTRMKTVKLLYMADRYHVVRYGTPVLGDVYYRLPWGPIPSRSLDMLESAADVAANDPEAPPDDFSARLLARIAVDKPESKYAEYRSREERQRAPDYLSQSEIEALDAVIKKYGDWSAVALS